MLEEIYVAIFVATLLGVLLRKKFRRAQPPSLPSLSEETDSEDELLCVEPLLCRPGRHGSSMQSMQSNGSMEIDTPEPEPDPMEVESDESSSSDFILKEKYY